SLLHQHATIRGMEVGSKQDFAEMNRAIAAKNIHPVIDKVFPFEQAQQAFAYLDQGLHFGKVAIAID
ncbi:MAG: zinc-binding dehydrogenase, partial [Xenococcaceae cyanobacterium]